jgi:hypothetical protein
MPNNNRAYKLDISQSASQKIPNSIEDPSKKKDLDVQNCYDSGTLWEVKALGLSDIVTQTGVKSDCVTQIQGISNE